MSARNRLQRIVILPLAVMSLCTARVAMAEPTTPPASADMDMPDDLGKPLDGVIPVRRSLATPGVLTIESPIEEIAADPRGKSVLQKDLPGLCERPEFVMFKSMTLPQLQTMSHGKLTKADLDQVQADLASERIAAAAPIRTHNPLVVGRRAVGRVTHAIYKRVVLVVASL